MTTDATLSPAAVVRQLAELGRELDAAVRLLKDAEVEAVTKRHEADMAESRAFVSAEGAMEMRKHLARIKGVAFRVLGERVDTFLSECSCDWSGLDRATPAEAADDGHKHVRGVL